MLTNKQKKKTYLHVLFDGPLIFFSLIPFPKLFFLKQINLQFMLDHEYADKTEKTYTIVSKLLETFAKTQNELTLCQLSAEEQYILAATVLDCSIMITFREIENVEMDEEKMSKGRR